MMVLQKWLGPAKEVKDMGKGCPFRPSPVGGQGGGEPFIGGRIRMQDEDGQAQSQSILPEPRWEGGRACSRGEEKAIINVRVLVRVARIAGNHSPHPVGHGNTQRSRIRPPHIQSGTFQLARFARREFHTIFPIFLKPFLEMSQHTAKWGCQPHLVFLPSLDQELQAY